MTIPRYRAGYIHDRGQGKVIGREESLGTLRGLIDAAASGHGTAVLITGEAGIGKSTLAAAATTYADDHGFLLLTAHGTRGGGRIGFSALHEILVPILHLLPELPTRQRAAIEVVFGLAEGSPPEPLILHISVLALLEEAASRQRVVVSIEDVHWVDSASLDVVGFLAPRLRTLPVVLMAMTRPVASSTRAAFPLEIVLPGLDPDDALRLVSTLRPDAPPSEWRRIIDVAGGNPLALTEFSGEVVPSLSPRPRTHLPLTSRLEAVFLADVATLPSRTQSALLVAAAGEDASLAELSAALEERESSLRHLAPAERAGLVHLGSDGFTFRHPLVSSAIYDAADASSRTDAHRALARAIRDPGRAAQHLAAATVGWDEDVAHALDTAADIAMTRGSRSEATASWAAAAAVTEDRDRRARRLALAAEAARQAGDVARAGELAAQCRELARETHTVYQLTTTEWMLSQTALYPAARTAAELVEIALSLDEPHLRVEILVFAAVRSYILQDTSGAASRIADELARTSGGNDALVEIGLGLVVPGRGVDIARALEAFRGPLRPVDAVLLNCLAFAAEEARDLDGAERVWSTARDAYHAVGRTADEATALCGRASVRLLQGSVAAGMADAAHALHLSDELGLDIVGAMACAVIARARALRGEDALHLKAVEGTQRRGGPEMFARVAATLAWAEGIAAANDGRVGDAWSAFDRTRANDPIALWALADAVEPAVRSGDTAAVEEWVERVMHESAATGSRHLELLAWRSRALLVHGDEVESAFRRALTAGAGAHASIDLARAHLLYGEWLRRSRQITRAREELRTALPIFQRESLQPLIDRTLSELRAAGESVRTSASRPDVATVLTAQELQVAQLAAQGMTNKQIADQVYLSHRTVGAHLHRAFAKLGVSRRSQLPGLFAAASSLEGVG